MTARARLGNAQALHPRFYGVEIVQIEGGDRRDFVCAFLEEAPFDPPIVGLVLRVIGVRTSDGLRHTQ